MYIEFQWYFNGSFRVRCTWNHNFSHFNEISNLNHLISAKIKVYDLTFRNPVSYKWTLTKPHILDTISIKTPIESQLIVSNHCSCCFLFDLYLFIRFFDIALLIRQIGIRWNNRIIKRVQPAYHCSLSCTNKFILLKFSGFFLNR